MSSNTKATKFTFIDLFSGIGGFHYAMENLGGKCVFASEIDPYAIQVYQRNHRMNSNHDITMVNENDIPDHDVLCAGFPCQAFSKAGSQLGFDDPTKGTLFFHIVRVLRAKRPKYIILENVRNLLSHDFGNTWRTIQEQLTSVGYNIKAIVMSPHQLNVPQLRERVYILGIRNDLYGLNLDFELPEPIDDPQFTEVLRTFFDENVDPRYSISEHEDRLLQCWDEFRQVIPQQIIGFPIWFDEFLGTYPLDGLPIWKQDFIRKNRDFYQRFKPQIDEWRNHWDNLQEFTPTERKFEWQAGNHAHSIWECYIQIRPSGVRVKTPTSFPALVALVQIPIIGRLRRRLTPREAARLQSFPRRFRPDSNDHQAYKQLGNAVNVNCVEYLARQLFSKYGNNGWGIKTQNCTSYQLNPHTYEIVKKGYDNSLDPREILLRLNRYLNGELILDDTGYNAGLYINRKNEAKYFIMVANLTFLGGRSGQHPPEKKRIQYDYSWRNYYNQHNGEGKVYWAGLYSYNDIDAWVIFEPYTYLERQRGKGDFSSRSCHASIYEVQEACRNGEIVKKKDNAGNTYYAVSKEKLIDFFDM